MKNNNKLLNIISSIIKSIDDGFVGIVGPAGVGKTFFSNEIAKILNCHVYSLDFRFIGDSLFRKELLYNKLKSSIDNYIDAVNQLNWWDWIKIENDLKTLEDKKIISIKSPYERNIGKNISDITIKHQNYTLVEGAILGDVNILKFFKKIIFLHSSQERRFNNLLKKDLNKRKFNEICARFLITEYSEMLYYKKLFKLKEMDILFFDVENENVISQPKYDDKKFIPIQFLDE